MACGPQLPKRKFKTFLTRLILGLRIASFRFIHQFYTLQLEKGFGVQLFPPLAPEMIKLLLLISML